MSIMREKYERSILEFAELVANSQTSGELLQQIRSPLIPAARRMSLLKLFRRCVSGVIDTEMAKKITKISTQTLVENYSSTFKPIATLKEQFASLNSEFISALAVAVGEYDSRGKQGYVLTQCFFDWFASALGEDLSIEGPTGSGPDIEFCSIFPDFVGACPCDFIIRKRADQRVLAVGFARYDSTRGGAQSDDRTSGNAAKVYIIRDYCISVGLLLRILFLADGPGLLTGTLG